MCGGVCLWRGGCYLPGGGGVRGLAGGGVPGLCFFSSSILRFASSVTVFSLVFCCVCRGGGGVVTYLGEVVLGVWRGEVGYLPGGGGVRGLAGGGVPGLCFFSSSILRFASSVTVFSLVSAVVTLV